MGKEQEAQAAFREAERLQTILSNSQSAKNLNDEGYSLWSYTWPQDWRRGMLTSCTACPRKTGQALDLMFKLQRDAGDWSSNDCWPPFESSAFQLATVAARAVGNAPGWLSQQQGG